MIVITQKVVIWCSRQISDIPKYHGISTGNYDPSKMTIT